MNDQIDILNDKLQNNTNEHNDNSAYLNKLLELKNDKICKIKDD